MDSYTFIFILVVTHCVCGQGQDTVNNLDQNVRVTGVKVPKDIQLPVQNTLLRDALDVTSQTSKDGILPPTVDIPGLPTSINNLAADLSAESQASADLVSAFVNTLQTGGNVNALVEAVNKLPEVEKNNIIKKIEEKINSLSPTDIAILNETYPELLSAVTMSGIASGNGQSLMTDSTSGSEQSATFQRETHTHTKKEISKTTPKEPEISPLIVPPQFLDVTHQPAAVRPPGVNKGTKDKQLTTTNLIVESKTAEVKRVSNNVDRSSEIPVSRTETLVSQTSFPPNMVTFVNEKGKRIVVDSNSLPTRRDQSAFGGGEQSITETIARQNTINIPFQDGAGVNLIDAKLPSMIDFNMNYDTSELKADQMDLALRDRTRQEALRVTPTVITDSTQTIGSGSIDSTSINRQAPITIPANDNTMTSGNAESFVSLRPVSQISQFGSKAKDSVPVMNFDVLRKMNADVINKHGEDVFRSWVSKMPGYVGTGRTGALPFEGSIALPFTYRENTISASADNADTAAAEEDNQILSDAGSVEANAAAEAGIVSEANIAAAPSTKRLIPYQLAPQSAYTPFVERPASHLSYLPYGRSQLSLPYRPHIIGHRRPKVTIIPRYFPVESHYRHQFRVGNEYRIPRRSIIRYPLGRRLPYRRLRSLPPRFPCRYGRCFRHRYPVPSPYPY